MMPKAEYGKSQRWRDKHCLLCAKPLNPNDPAVKTRAVFGKRDGGDDVVHGLSHESCAKSAMIIIACEQTVKKEGSE